MILTKYESKSKYFYQLLNMISFCNNNLLILLKNLIYNKKFIIIIIMNFTADQSCDHAVSMFSKHVRKSEKSKNSCLNLLYIYYSFSAVCSNYLASAASIFLDLNFLNSC